MPPFPKPDFSYDYRVSSQVNALRRYRDSKPGRQIPPRAPDRMLLATWNIANLGVQDRSEDDDELIAEILSWFDLVAIQEVNDNLAGLRGIQEKLPDHYRLLFSDPAGNDERLTFLYDSRKVRQLEEVGELAIPPSDLRYIKLPGISQLFDGFDRNPYLGLFQAGTFSFQLASVHLYFGSDSKISMNRRALETFAVARWADQRRKSAFSATRDIIALGDFNLPKASPGDPIFDELTRRGLQLPAHSTQIGSSIAEDNHYDQIGFFPGETQEQFTGRSGVFDFDGALFRTLWETRPRQDFLAYVRYHISDHRPLWAEFAI
jgi:endonuclease/exonuclease/phosphatase family metal-dependent hydrolase